MSPKAIETFSTFGVAVLCLALGIMALAVFFTAWSWLASRGAKPEMMAVRGVLKKDTWATVHMSGAETFERVRFIGFTNTEGLKTHLPYDLNGMVILEDPEGRRYLVRAKAIRMIVIAPAAGGGGSKEA
ncbi:MAG: hypothetical protein JWO38_6834 [Gemmataceae bacterium]|nr:hypothetical protein [Gemmataceae bacterium]